MEFKDVTPRIDQGDDSMLILTLKDTDRYYLGVFQASLNGEQHGDVFLSMTVSEWRRLSDALNKSLEG